MRLVTPLHPDFTHQKDEILPKVLLRLAKILLAIYQRKTRYQRVTVRAARHQRVRLWRLCRGGCGVCACRVCACRRSRCQVQPTIDDPTQLGNLWEVIYRYSSPTCSVNISFAKAGLIRRRRRRSRWGRGVRCAIGGEMARAPIL